MIKKEPLARETGGSRCRPLSRAKLIYLIANLGRKPQDQMIKKEPLARETGGSRCRPLSRAKLIYLMANLGLAPQALCLRLLRRLRNNLKTTGFMLTPASQATR